MKKLLLTVALISASFFVFGTESKKKASYTDVKVITEQVECKANTTDTVTVNLNYMNKVRMYDINRVYIHNVNRDRIYILNSRGRVVCVTEDDVNLDLPCGDYWIFSDSNITSQYIMN